ncbi:hypothetical protein D9M73_221480 [compost metagenome]
MFRPIPPPSESARVGSSSTSTGCPAARLPCMAAPRCMLMPWVMMFALTLLIASATPANKPPPDNGTRICATSGCCSRISSPSVPCPAMMAG